MAHTFNALEYAECKAARNMRVIYRIHHGEKQYYAGLDLPYYRPLWTADRDTAVRLTPRDCGMMQQTELV